VILFCTAAGISHAAAGITASMAIRGFILMIALSRDANLSMYLFHHGPSILKPHELLSQAQPQYDAKIAPRELS